MDVSLSKLWETVKDREAWHAAIHWVTGSDTTDQLNNNIYFPGGSDGKEPVCNVRELGSIPGLGRSLGEGNGYHSSILACRIPWTEEPGGL